ncbi:hypothetical protein PG993_010659 [Apiospora rasikravindrae]|uniref:DUF1772-domain-containing protein n=1 Tax=Apiospora rasikravindrae TaxID=990691 RepID=A0ABR1SMY2_9PEZI
MSANTAMEAVAGVTMACSFALAGNAFTQSFMSVPALLVSFPSPQSPSHAEKARLLGRQWLVFWAHAGHRGIRSRRMGGRFGGGNWKLFAIAAGCNLVNVVHSAINMQPINVRLAALAQVGTGHGNDKLDAHSVGAVQVEKAEEYARRWGRLNLVRMAMSLIAGALAMSQLLER